MLFVFDIGDPGYKRIMLKKILRVIGDITMNILLIIKMTTVETN